MKPARFRKVHVPAHRDYTLTLVRTDGRREEHYLPYVYDTLEAAQAEADRHNRRYRHGQLIVEWVDRPAGDAWQTTIKL